MIIIDHICGPKGCLIYFYYFIIILLFYYKKLPHQKKKSYNMMMIYIKIDFILYFFLLAITNLS
jgi:hypothetical protein